MGAETPAAWGYYRAQIDGARHSAGVDVSRMWGDASDGGDASGLSWSLVRRSKLPNIAQQFFSAAGIKPASDSRGSYAGSHCYWPPRRRARVARTLLSAKVSSQKHGLRRLQPPVAQRAEQSRGLFQPARLGPGRR